MFNSSGRKSIFLSWLLSFCPAHRSVCGKDPPSVKLPSSFSSKLWERRSLKYPWISVWLCLIWSFLCNIKENAVWCLLLLLLLSSLQLERSHQVWWDWWVSHDSLLSSLSPALDGSKESVFRRHSDPASGPTVCFRTFQTEWNDLEVCEQQPWSELFEFSKH